MKFQLGHKGRVDAKLPAKYLTPRSRAVLTVKVLLISEARNMTTICFLIIWDISKVYTLEGLKKLDFNNIYIVLKGKIQTRTFTINSPLLAN